MAEIQTAVEVSQVYWLELADVLVVQCQAQLVHTCVMHHLQCLHHKCRKLVTKGWQPWAYDPDTKPACAGMTHGVVSRERRALFSGIVAGLADAGAAVQGGRCPSSPSSCKHTSGEAAQRDVLAPQACARHSSPPPSHTDFHNHAS